MIIIPTEYRIHRYAYVRFVGEKIINNIFVVFPMNRKYSNTRSHDRYPFASSRFFLVLRHFPKERKCINGKYLKMIRLTNCSWLLRYSSRFLNQFEIYMHKSFLSIQFRINESNTRNSVQFKNKYWDYTIHMIYDIYNRYFAFKWLTYSNPLKDELR